MKTNENLFISDLHLTLEKPELTRCFVNFLEGRAQQAKALYILGDLFDSWVGDDDTTPPIGKISTALRNLHESGTEVFLQLGNRDFLIGKQFCELTGVKLLPDYAVIDLYGEPTLLTHGDLLCTDDLPYQEFRIKSRSPAWQDYVLSKPLWLRLLAARWYRVRSFFHKRAKTQDIMDVNAETVAQVMLSHQVQRLIHGHTHRPAIHDLKLDDRPAQRIVLPNWTREQMQMLCFDAEGYRIESLL